MIEIVFFTTVIGVVCISRMIGFIVCKDMSVIELKTDETKE
jgi:hypothetical protein